jgi:flagellar hook-length control protein FliK
VLTGWRQPVAGTVPEAARASKTEVPDTAPRVQGVPVAGLAENLEEPVQPALVSEPVSVETVQFQRIGVKVPPVLTGWRQPIVVTVPEAARVSKAEVPGISPRVSGSMDAGGAWASTSPRVQGVSVLGLTESLGEPVQPTMVSDPVSAEPVQPPMVDVKAPPIVTGGRHSSVVTALESESESAMKADASSTDQDVPVKGTSKMHRQQRDLQSVSNMMNAKQSAEKNAVDVNLDIAKKVPADSMFMDATAPEKVQVDQQDDIDRPQSVKARSAAFHPAKDSAETGGIVVTSAETSNADDNDTASMFMAANNSDKFSGAEKDASIQPSEPKFADLAINFAKEGQVEKTSGVNSTSTESRSEGRTFQTEVLQQIVEKTTTDFKSGRSEIRIDLKPESLGHLRLHVTTEHQQVSVKILAENSLVKEMIENQSSLIKNELQNQGINVNSVKVDILMSGGSDFASSQNEGSAFKQSRHEPAYGSGKGLNGKSALIDPEPSEQTGNRGGYLVNYFA